MVQSVAKEEQKIKKRMDGKSFDKKPNKINEDRITKINAKGKEF